MIGVVWYVWTIVAAYAWLHGGRIGKRLSVAELLAAAVPVGAVGGSWLVYLSAILLGSLSKGSILLSSVVMLWMSWGRWGPALRALFRTFGDVRGALGLGRWGLSAAVVTPLDGFIALALVAVTSAFLWPIYSSRMIPTDEAGQPWTAGSCYGDLPIHMAIANSFLHGVNTRVAWPTWRDENGGYTLMSPIFAGEPLTYPFLPDFHAAILVRAGDTLRNGFLAPGFSLAAALWALLYFLGVRVTHSRLGAVLGVFLTMFAGGMGGWRWAQAQGWESAYHHDVVQHDPTGDWKYLWFAFVPHIMLPQRGANFAYPLAVVVLILVWVATAGETQQTGTGASSTPTGSAVVSTPAGVSTGTLSIADRRSLLCHAAIFTALLPLVQAHSFIGLGVIIGVVFVLDAHKWLADLRLLAAWAQAGLFVILVGQPQLSLFQKTVDHGFNGNFMQFGWLYLHFDFGAPYGVSGFFRFWWYSLGPAFNLFVVALAWFLLDTGLGFLTGRMLKAERGADAINRYLQVRDRESAAVAAGAGYVASGSGSSGAGALPMSPGHGARAPRDVAAAASAARRAATAGLPLSAYASQKQDDDASPSYLEFVLSRFIENFDLQAVSRALKLYSLDNFVSPFNSLSPTGRALDAAKLGLGALAVFIMANYINFQPWERDNAKIFYIWVFVASPMSGAVLAAPVECLLRGGPALGRLSRLFNGPTTEGLLDSKDKPLKLGAATAGGAPSPLTSLAAKGSSLAGALVSSVLFYLSVLSGYIMLHQEWRMQNSPLFDHDGLAVSAWMRAHVPRRAVVMHSNSHVQPSTSLAARPSLVAYYGWVSNHGYNCGPRLQDRDYAMDNALKDNDQHAYGLFRKWGVRYVVGEYLRRHERAPGADPTSFLDNGLKEVFAAGRYQVLQVMGYPEDAFKDADDLGN